MFVVTVVFEIREERMDEFMPLVAAQAVNSLEKEDGCLQFDVCAGGNEPHEVFLYEVYTDESAFSAHLASDHFIAFDKAVGDMVAGKTVKTYGLVAGKKPLL